MNLQQYILLTIGSGPFQNEISVAVKENIWFPGNNVALCRHNLHLKTSSNGNLDSICLLKRKNLIIAYNHVHLPFSQMLNSWWGAEDRRAGGDMGN